MRRHPDIELLGVDPAAGMVAIAERKVAREGLTGARFTVLPFEAVRNTGSKAGRRTEATAARARIARLANN